jgi:hypothetical protein
LDKAQPRAAKPHPTILTSALLAWVGATGPFIPFEGPTANAQWTVTDTTGSINIVPSTFASQCAPASLIVPAGDFSATIVRGSAGALPSHTYTLGNTGGSAIYLPATPYYPNGIVYFDLTGVTTIGPKGSVNVTVAFNAAARNLAPGLYNASVAFSNAAALSFVATRQITLTVLAAPTHDFNGDGKSDIVWRDTSGNTAVWLMNAGQVLSSGTLGAVATSWSIVGQRDFDGDGKADWIWRDTSGNTVMWFLNGAQVSSSAGLGNISTVWSIVSTSDFNGDGKGDILWRNTNGNLAMWLMNGGQVSSSAGLGNVSTAWTIAATADFNGDGKGDILWRDTSGNLAM